MHCGEAACKIICPVEAISHTPLGTVAIDLEKCIGCGACVTVCPFEVPRVDPLINKARKCTMCYDRMANDRVPASAGTCPLGALQYGDRDEIIALGEEKVAALKERGYVSARLYGVEELGGFGIIYVLIDSPAAYNFPETPTISASIYLWRAALGPVKTLAAVALAAGSLSNWLKMREKEVMKEKKEEIRFG